MRREELLRRIDNSTASSSQTTAYCLLPTAYCFTPPLLQFGWVCGTMGDMDLCISGCFFPLNYYDVNKNPLKDRYQTSRLEQSNCIVCYCSGNP